MSTPNTIKHPLLQTPGMLESRLDQKEPVIKFHETTSNLERKCYHLIFSMKRKTIFLCFGRKEIERNEENGRINPFSLSHKSKPFNGERKEKWKYLLKINLAGNWIHGSYFRSYCWFKKPLNGLQNIKRSLLNPILAFN